MLDAPYVFDSLEHQRRVFTSNASELQALYDTTTPLGFNVLATYCTGARNIYTRNTPIVTPSDLTGQRIRAGNSLQTNTITAMGGQAVAMSFSEIYSAIQTGVIDGSEAPLSIYFDNVHYEVAPYFNYTGHIVYPEHLVIGNEAIGKMSLEDRAALEQLCQDSIFSGYEKVVAMEAEYRSTAESKGVTFVTADMSAFKAACQNLTQAAAGRSAVTQNLYDYIVSIK